jgi:hypothetical protein
MQQIFKRFIGGGLDSDTAEHLVESDRFISGENFRVWSSDKGQSGYIENILKNAEKYHTLPSGGTNIRIGTAVDEENGFIVKFNYNSNGDHGIYLYDIVGDVWYDVLLNDDVEDTLFYTSSGLNFNKNKLITAFIVNNKLYFNDNYNEPRCLHLGAFMAGYYSSQPISSNYAVSFPIDETEITLIKRPPVIPPSITKMGDSGFNNNFIKNDSFQFAVQWVYFDGEQSVLSGWSNSSLLNKESDASNYIHISLNETGTTPKSVRLIRLIAITDLQNGKGRYAYVVKTWDRAIQSENTEINTTTLSYDFYGNISGETIDNATLVEPFHSVPFLSGAMAIAKNRVLLSDNTEGHERPTQTSLSLSLPSPVTMGFTTLTKKLYQVTHAGVWGANNANSYAYSGWYVYMNEVSPAGWYAVASTEQLNTTSNVYPPLPSAPTTAAYGTDLQFRGLNQADVLNATKPDGGTAITWDFYLTANNLTVTGISQDVYNVFLPQSQYKACVIFYDRYLRDCGTIESDDIISIPARDYAFSQGYATFDWALSNTNAVDEIPDDAFYFSVGRTLNQITRYFVASFDDAVRYATYNSTTQLLEFTATTYASNAIAIGVNRKALLQANLGYAYTDGDQCILIDNSNNRYELPVIGEEGEYVLLKPTDVGTTTSKKWVYRIYTPYKTSEQEPFFEFGSINTIKNPTTLSREYDTLSGSFRADTVAITRNYNSNTYYAEAMNPNDTYFQRWDTDAGRSTLITKLGQVRYKTGLRFSDTYIQGTMTNGLSAFHALNREILSEDIGTIRGLVSASKVQKEGNVLLAIGENEAVSIYLGETEVFDAEGNSFLAKTDKFIGQINPLKGGYGTSNPESIVEHDGNVSWFSKLRGAFVTYSLNGIFPISQNGLTRVSKLFADKYASLSNEQIEAFGSRPFVFGGYDPYHRELYFSIPSTESTPPKGYLSDYVSPDFPVIYPYDIYDGVGKTLVYKIDADRWGAPHKYQTEGFCTIRNLLYSCKNGSLYKHNVDDGTSDTYNNFYGDSVKTGIGVIINENSNIVKEYLTLSVESTDIKPDWTHLRTELPNVQSSDIVYNDSDLKPEFTTREGVHYAEIKRDRLSPNTSGTYNVKLFKGDVMRGQWLKCYFEYDTNKQLQIRFFNVGARISDGHKT